MLRFIATKDIFRKRIPDLRSFAQWTQISRLGGNQACCEKQRIFRHCRVLHGRGDGKRATARDGMPTRTYFVAMPGRDIIRQKGRNCSPVPRDMRLAVRGFSRHTSWGKPICPEGLLNSNILIA